MPWKAAGLQRHYLECSILICSICAGDRKENSLSDNPPPQEVLENPDFKKTSKTIVKQLVNIRLVPEVTEYHADVYYNPKTGERIHARFPAGVVDDVNYGGSIKAFLFLLNNDCCTSIDKSRKFLSDLTDSTFPRE